MTFATDYTEANFDGLVGPTHNYAGLSPGNLASIQHRQQVSNPRQAALQGLAKMRWMVERGVPQAVLPPQIRPDFKWMQRLGYDGEPEFALRRMVQQQPLLFANLSSASAMWVANAATVTPSCDSRHRKLCLTPANLMQNLHRRVEVNHTHRLLRELFADETCFQVNSPLPAAVALSDEGAANHMRIVWGDGDQAVNVFVFGIDDRSGIRPATYPARQTRLASEAVAHLNGLCLEDSLFLQQSPEAIDAGVFHNDVIALSHTGLLMCHEKAFVDQNRQLHRLNGLSNGGINIIEVADSDVSLKEAVESYLFNSQIVSRDDGKLAMLLPLQCQNIRSVHHFVERVLKVRAGIEEIAYFDLNQSMSNGGGPACLRLRITMTANERQALQGDVWLDQRKLYELEQVVTRFYPEQLTLEDLSDWTLTQSLNEAVCRIHDCLGLSGAVTPAGEG